MTDKQDQNDEIHSMSRKFEAISTTDQNSNSHGGGNNSNLNDHHVRVTPDLPVLPVIGKNVPERIIFMIDSIREKDCTPFEFESGARLFPLQVIKKVVQIFIDLKGTMNKNHEFAIMKLTENSAEWICNFTNNSKTLMNWLESIDEITEDQNLGDFDLAQCFNVLDSNIELDYSSKPPDTITRVILIYSRSHCIPFQSDVKYFTSLMENPHFFLDVMYVHERANGENECEEVYLPLGQLDIKQNSYIFEVARNAVVLHNTMAQLLKHPLQRGKQPETTTSVEGSDGQGV